MADTLNGWTILGHWRSGPNGTYTVTAKRGSQVLRTERLSWEEVEAYNPQARWDHGRRMGNSPAAQTAVAA